LDGDAAAVRAMSVGSLVSAMTPVPGQVSWQIDEPPASAGIVESGAVVSWSAACGQQAVGAPAPSAGPDATHGSAPSDSANASSIAKERAARALAKGATRDIRGL